MREVPFMTQSLLCAGILLGVSLGTAACDFEEGAPGARGFCGASTGQPLCEDESIEDAADACAKLVECASIPVSPPDGVDNPNDFFTYSTCVARIEGYPEHRQFVAVACIAASTCDQLRFVNGPNAPRNRSSDMPACLEYGDQ